MAEAWQKQLLRAGDGAEDFCAVEATQSSRLPARRGMFYSVVLPVGNHMHAHCEAAAPLPVHRHIGSHLQPR